jgi:hypothetical protein
LAKNKKTPSYLDGVCGPAWTNFTAPLNSVFYLFN